MEADTISKSYESPLFFFSFLIFRANLHLGFMLHCFLQARDSRAKAGSGGTSVRTEKAELEALQATVEKQRIDADQASKKAKLTERR